MAEHVPVKSSNINSVSYDPDTKTMEVKFKSGQTYAYQGVDAEKHAALMSADSVGGFIHAHIKGKHAHSKADS